MWSEKQTKCSYDDAKLFIEQLNQEKHLGYLDWRLPKRFELVQAFDNNELGFNNYHYWAFNNLDNFFWYVSFTSGSSDMYIKESEFYIRGIRN